MMMADPIAKTKAMAIFVALAGMFLGAFYRDHNHSSEKKDTTAGVVVKITVRSY